MDTKVDGTRSCTRRFNSLALALMTMVGGCARESEAQPASTSAQPAGVSAQPADASTQPASAPAQPERVPVTVTLPLGEAPTFAGRPATLAELLPSSWRRQLPVELSPEAFDAMGLDWSAPIGLVDYGCAYFASIRDLDRLEANFTLSPEPPPSPQQTIRMVDGVQEVEVEAMPSPDCDWSAAPVDQPYHALWVSDEARAKGWRSYQGSDGRTISIIGTTVLFSVAEPWASRNAALELTLAGDLALTGETPVSLTWDRPYLFGADQTTPAALAGFMARIWNFRVPEGFHGSDRSGDTADEPYRAAKSSYRAEQRRLLAATEAELGTRLGSIQATQRDPNDRLYTRLDAPAMLMASLATTYEQGTRSVVLDTLGLRVTAEAAAQAERWAQARAPVMLNVHLLGVLSDDGSALEGVLSDMSSADLTDLLEQAGAESTGDAQFTDTGAGSGSSADLKAGGGALDGGALDGGALDGGGSN